MKNNLMTWVTAAALLFTFHTHSAPIDIKHIDFNPVIDGQLDQELDHLKFNEFAHYYDFGDPVEKEIKVRYKLAYNDKYFYLYIETDANKITYNTRGYLYGDGYKIILGKLINNQTTDEYYDLYYSPSLNKNQRDKQVIATYNRHHITKLLSKNSLSQEMAHSKSTGFETLIAWDDIHPINPLFDSDIGLNIYFAKSVTKVDSVGYSLTKDESIWDEEVLSRNLSAVNFIPPATQVKSVQVFKRNYQLNEDIRIKSISLDSKDALNVTVLNNMGEQVINKNIKLTPKSDQKIEHKINTEALKSGTYDIHVMINNTPVETASISILESIEFKKIANEIVNKTNNANKKAQSTLLFHLQEANKTSQALKPYEIATQLIQKWKDTFKLVNTFLKGKDPFANLQGPYRRAFLSKIDNTYQPYSIKLPNNYDASKKYPLLVFLHGSGQDEQRLLSKPRSNGKFIELAPLGRDLFRAYSMKDSQIDIMEAIQDVKLHFSVDSQKIIIGGFSMGGYGALRTFYENPEIYKGVAIFAGHPDLANQWGVEGTHPNFLEPHDTQVFKNIPVFIYHGTKDEALDFNTIKKLKDALLQAGAQVKSSFVEGRGHTYQDDETNTLYHQWLEQFME